MQERKSNYTYILLQSCCDTETPRIQPASGSYFRPKIHLLREFSSADQAPRQFDFEYFPDIDRGLRRSLLVDLEGCVFWWPFSDSIGEDQGLHPVETIIYLLDTDLVPYIYATWWIESILKWVKTKGYL